MRVHYLQHAPNEGPGRIESWAQAKGHTVTGTKIYAGQPLPHPGEIDWLVIMGGAMNVYEYRLHPWLRPEKRFIENVLGAGKAVIGVCLGAQLIADLSGKKVYQNPEIEKGWHPVRMLPAASEDSLFKDFPKTLTPLHWHGDTFDLPEAATRIAESDACANQAFVIGDRIIGFQFHIEVTEGDVREFLTRYKPMTGRYIQSETEIREGTRNLKNVHAALHSMLDRLEERTAS